MRVAIIGHGPSILEADADEINSHEVVVKQKQCAGPGRVDVVVGSVNQAKVLRENRRDNDKWVFIDSRFGDWTDEQIQFAARGCRYDRALCDEWNAKYRALREPFERWGQTVSHSVASDELGHKHMSSGLHALLYACAFLQPEVVNLFGYDNVKNGDFTWSVTRGKDWVRYPDHRWDIENKMVRTMADHFNVRVNFV